LGGRLLQLGDESRSEDVAGWVAKHRTTAPGADAASWRRRVGARRPAWSARERRSARDADAIAEARAKPLEGDEMAEIREEAAAVAIIRV